MMAQDVQFVILVTKDALLLCHIKCGEWPFLFATIVAYTKILLYIADLKFGLRVNATAFCVDINFHSCFNFFSFLGKNQIFENRQKNF